MAENFLDNIFSKLNSRSKEVIFVTVSARNVLEVAKVDPESNTVVRYGQKKLEYNESLKEIKDYTEFKNTLVDLLNELNIPIRSDIYLSLPTVLLGKIELPGILSDEGINEAIISEAEQSYIFKRSEPMVSYWYNLSETETTENRVLLYSAIQKQAIDSIKEVLSELGINLLGVEPSLISQLRALKHLGKISEQIGKDKTWLLMNITSTGYSLTTLQGEKIIEHYEEPLALKTYEGEEVYEAIYVSVQIALLNTHANNLFVISETDLVSAENMAGRIPLEGEIVFLENNRYRQQPIIQVNEENVPESEADLISLEAVGTALRNITKYSIIFDYIGMYQALKEAFVLKMGEKEYVITEDVLKRLIMILSIALVLPAVALLIIASTIEKQEKQKLDKVNSEIQSVESKINEIKKLTDANKNNFDEKTEIEKVIKSNKAKIKLYSAMGESVPKNLWITYFIAKGEGKVDISGVSTNVEDIYIFYKNMKDSLLDSQLRLQKLEMENASVDDVITSSENYMFEITNMTEAELNPPKDKDGNTKNQEAENSDNPDENNNADKKNKKDKKEKKDKGSEDKGPEVKDLEEVEVH